MALKAHIIFVLTFFAAIVLSVGFACADNKNPSPNQILKAFQDGKTVTITTRGNIVGSPYGGYYAAPYGSVVYAHPPYPYAPPPGYYPQYYPQPYPVPPAYGLGYATGVIVNR